MINNFPNIRQHDAMDCAPACLAIISKYYGKKFDIKTLSEISYYTRKGVSLKSLSYAAEQLGFKTYGLCTSYENLLHTNPVPFIAYWKQSHFLVVYKITVKHVWISDPAEGKYKLKREEFIQNWATTIEENTPKGICLLLTPQKMFFDENILNTKNQHKTLIFRFLLTYLWPYKKLFFQLLIGLVIGSLIQLILPFLMQSLVDIGVKEKDLDFVYLVLIAQFILIVSSSIVEIIRSWILLHLGTRINISIISDYLSKLLRLPISYFEKKMTGDIKQRIDDHHRIEQFLTSNSLSFLFSILNIIIFSIVLGIYSIKILLIFYIGTIIYLTWVSFFLKKRKRYDGLRFKQQSENQTILYSLITQMQEIKLQNIEHKKKWEWEHFQIRLFKLNIKILAFNQTQNAGAFLISSLLLMILSIVSAKSVIQNEITLGMMLSIQYIIGMLTSPIEQMVSFINATQDAKLSMERLVEVHFIDDENKDKIKEINNLSGDIVIDNLSYRYEGPYSPFVLNNVSFFIPQNKVTAIVGPSGSGKTTLMKLLLGFYQPTHGDIKIQDISLFNISPFAWREKVGAVMQDGIIFSDTIAHNIAISDENPDVNKLIDAAKKACIHDFIMSLPLKYNTKIGDDGSGLSQGQKQRILIARAIYKNPDYLFLDEATNALDANTEKEITENLNEFYRNKTVVVIAHRLSTVKNADQIIVLSKGHIIEKGTHNELIKAKGYYYNLVKEQLNQ